MSDSASTRRPNRLIDSRSPYLLQHAHNPVDWFPWCREALELSRARNVPIFLSIGYSACHWCHVMEREVFENQLIAQYMNEHFVNIKVDREERPDLDELYMLATQLTTGSGGWPMSVWLTPDIKPFYAGTYFPPDDQMGRPGFPSVLSAITTAWRDKRTQVLQQADHIAQAVTGHLAGTGDPEAAFDFPAFLASALEQCEKRVDLTWGGLSGAPKFPPHQTLLLWIVLLEQHAAGAIPMAANLSMDCLAHVRTWLTVTLDRMAAGGIYDQIAGGFSRYSTDEQWLVPHFEKMLYDNAQLALVYARAGVLLNRGDYTQIARETLDFWLREWTTAEGLFCSSLDADSQGEEGKFYLWHWQEILQAIPDSIDRHLACAHWNLSPAGNWQGHNILHVQTSAAQLEVEFAHLSPGPRQRLQEIKLKLLAMRSARVAPHCDDKILVGWNGLMIQALAQAALLMNEPRYYQAAERAATAILAVHRDVAGGLLHVSRAGRADIPAFLEDYACFGLGAWNLAVAAGQFAPQNVSTWMDESQNAARNISEHFYDSRTGRFYITSDRHEQLFVRVPSGSDNAVPSAAAMAISLMLKLDATTPCAAYSAVVARGIAALSPLIGQYPVAFSSLLSVALEHWTSVSKAAAQ